MICLPRLRREHRPAFWRVSCFLGSFLPIANQIARCIIPPKCADFATRRARVSSPSTRLLFQGFPRFGSPPSRCLTDWRRHLAGSPPVRRRYVHARCTRRGFPLQPALHAGHRLRCHRRPFGVATPRAFNSAAIAASDRPDSSASTGRSASARPLASSRVADAGVEAAKFDAALPSGGERVLGPLADQPALLLGKRGVDVEHEGVTSAPARRR